MQFALFKNSNLNQYERNLDLWSTVLELLERAEFCNRIAGKYSWKPLKFEILLNLKRCWQWVRFSNHCNTSFCTLNVTSSWRGFDKSDFFKLLKFLGHPFFLVSQVQIERVWKRGSLVRSVKFFKHLQYKCREKILRRLLKFEWRSLLKLFQKDCPVRCNEGRVRVEEGKQISGRPASKLFVESRFSSLDFLRRHPDEGKKGNFSCERKVEFYFLQVMKYFFWDSGAPIEF